MKLGLAVLPLEVWADIFLSPYQWITRQELAEFYNNIKNRGFANKLEKLLHDCGKHSLRYLDISSKHFVEPKCKYELRKRKLAKPRALLSVAPDFDGWRSYVRDGLPNAKECEFSQTEMPENVKTFKRIAIRYLDDEVLAFLDKIKPLFTNVYLVIRPTQSAPNDMQIILTQLFPLLGIIRGIHCDAIGMELLEQQFPGTLARATNELNLFNPEPASIPACLNWLNTPQQDFDVHGPKFLRAYANPTTIFAFVDAVRKQFLTAATQSAFVIYLQFKSVDRHRRADEITFENAITKEELTIRNAQFNKPDGIIIQYVEILRHPTGANAIMQEWIKQWAYFEKKFNGNYEENKVIWIYEPTIGRITKQAEDEPANGNETVGEDNEEVGPSTSRQITKKKKLNHGEDEAGPSTRAKKMREE